MLCLRPFDYQILKFGSGWPVDGIHKCEEQPQHNVPIINTEMMNQNKVNTRWENLIL
jgi:hypothetical protein